MPEYIERLTRCGMNLIDAYEACDDFLYDCDYEGLRDYVIAVEEEALRRLDRVY